MEQIRGVTVDGVVQTLVERELIEVRGEADAPGRPRLYGTTLFFLEHFGLKGLGELPAADELRRIQLELATVPADKSQEELPLDNETEEADDDQDDEDDDDE
jgi:segregation and condensation protein B